jgi:hypothetical protein
LWSSVVLVAVLSALGYVLVGRGGAAGAGHLRAGAAGMSLRRAAFAIPGDITTPTGGYIYERRLLEALRAQGRDVRHLQAWHLVSRPDAGRHGRRDRAASSLEPDRAVILDGFISATLDTDALAGLHVPSVAMVHHPLALETGLEPGAAGTSLPDRARRTSPISHVLVPSPATAAMLTGSYDVPAERITIARPGTDRPSRQRAPVSPPLILSVGIQHPRKGHDVC